uniref:protein-tyrosine-phosphatase n=1 Tax=Cannabis sativa TaxID=3483 RepID=A0A803QPP9_CANSA
MPYLVRENLFIGNIGDAAEVLQNGSSDITHILSMLSTASISIFSEWRSGLTIPTKEIKTHYVGASETEDDSASEDESTELSSSAMSPGKVLYSLEYAGKDLKVVRMAVPMRDMESENLLDHLDVCLNFIDESRKKGSVLVHCFAGVSRSLKCLRKWVSRWIVLAPYINDSALKYWVSAITVERE